MNEGCQADDPNAGKRGWTYTLWRTRYRRFYTVLIACYSAFLVPYVLFYDATPYDLTLLAAISTCGAVLVAALWRKEDVKKPWERLNINPGTKLFLAGGLGAVFVETEFLVWEYVLHAKGVAANPNLAIDLLETMPWYLLVLALLTVSLRHTKPTLFQLMVLGGVYELMSDGILGSLVGGTLGSDWLFLLVLVPIFTIVYSPIIALPAMAAWRSYQETWTRNPPHGSRAWLFLPCAAVLLYGPYLVLFLTLFH